MEQVIQLAVVFGIFVFLMGLGLVVGGARERSHLRDLAEREQRLAGMLVTQIRNFPQAAASAQPPQMIVAEAVISSDYLKTFLAGLKNFFGGEVRSFVTLLDRARREATLRVMEEAQQAGYNAVCNLRLDTAQIHNAATSKMPMATIMASGTAYHAGPASLAEQMVVPEVVDE